MQRVTNRSNNKIAQWNPNQIPDQHGLIVDQRTSIKGHNAYHTRFALIDAHKRGKLEEYQKQRRRAEDLPKHALEHQVGIAVETLFRRGENTLYPPQLSTMVTIKCEIIESVSNSPTCGYLYQIMEMIIPGNAAQPKTTSG